MSTLPLTIPCRFWTSTESAPAPVLIVRLSTPTPSPILELATYAQSLPRPVLMNIEPRVLAPQTITSSLSGAFQGPVVAAFAAEVEYATTGTGAPTSMWTLLKLGALRAPPGPPS